MHLGLIGYGSIAQTLIGLLAERATVSRLTVLARPGRGATVREALSAGARGVPQRTSSRRPGR